MSNNLPALVKVAAEIANAAIHEDGSLIPTLMYRDSQGKIGLVVVQALFAAEISSEQRRSELQYILGQVQATAYVLITEGWLVITPATTGGEDEARAAAGLAPDQSIADHPDRQEVVVISYQDMLTDQIVMMSAILYRRGDEVWLGEFKEAQQAGGQMVGLFNNPGDWKAS